MKKISYDGIGAVVATFNVESSVETGTVVKLSAGSTVAEPEAGDSFIGVVFDCDSPLAAVQLRGFVTLTCTGVLGLGQVSLLADGNGGVQEGSGGVSCIVVDNSVTGYVTLCL